MCTLSRENVHVGHEIFGYLPNGMEGWGRRFREARKALGVTQADVAERINADRTIVSKIEREQHFPTIPDQLNRLCQYLRVPAEEILAARGVWLTPPAAARLPRALVMGILALPPERLASLTELLAPLPNGVSPGFGQR